MATSQKPPYVPQDPQEVAEMLHALESHRDKGKKGPGSFSVKKNTFVVPGSQTRTVDSWKMQEWDYKKPNLPTYARGLFTYTRSDNVGEIAIRGYDKFFNIEEVGKTKWSNIIQNTLGPYELSVKENGCIIFISGLDDGTLLVCSKHSVGDREDVDVSHAVVGERWVDRQLASLGRSRGDLARELRKRNATAVAELCDDSFEEHVLQYMPEHAGLYLHGINLNLPWFATYPEHLVEKFAEDWAFKKTMYVVKQNIHEVRTFLEGIGETGHYAGRDTEGFVIRCRARETPHSPWQDWFFKYKFEEPYLMYRQWRECTKAIIAGKPPKFRKHKQITEEYLKYARKRLADNPSLAKAFNQNHGIISMRNGFLAEKGMKGADVIRAENDSAPTGNASNVTKNVVLVPVATIGCGKTTVANALVSLFGWGHVQNDNIEGRKNRPQRFAAECLNQLAAKGVLIADRNNHQRREREQIINDMQESIPDVHFVALHYVHDRGNYGEIRKAMQARVLQRGDNHQTIQASSKGSDEIIGIMDGFMNRFQPVDTNRPPDDAFELVINLDVTAHSRDNLETVIETLYSEYPGLFPSKIPTASDMDEAIGAAMNEYIPTVKHDLSRPSDTKRQQNGQKQCWDHTKQNKVERRSELGHTNGSITQKPQKAKPVEYFCVRLPTNRIQAILDAVFRDQPPEVTKFYRQLQQTRRLQPAYHITLIHRATSRSHLDNWERLNKRYEDTKASINDDHSNPANTASNSASEIDLLLPCRVHLERLVWDKRLMTVVARLLDADPFKGLVCTNDVAHVTIGTASTDIKPKESNDLLARWLSEGSGAEKAIWEVVVKGSVVVEGKLVAVLGR